METVTLLEATSTSSLLPEAAKTLVTDFSAQIIPTVVELLLVLVPVGLSLWAIGFGVRKGLNFLKKNANKSV